MRFSPRLAAAAAATLGALVAAPAIPAPAFRDLNHNGRLDPYEDARLAVERRVDDLLGRMTVAEKAGTLLHGTLPVTGIHRAGRTRAMT